MENKKSIISEIISPFLDLFKTSNAQKIVNGTYLLEGVVYFGMLTLMVMYFNKYIGLDDIQASHMVGFLTAGITLSMLFLGAAVDWIGVRKSLIIALLFSLAGRLIMVLAPQAQGLGGMWSLKYILAALGMLGIIIGYGVYQPACYAAIRLFASKEQAPMGYAMLYALMNLGGFLPGIISAPIRNLGDSLDKGNGVVWVYWLYTILTFISFAIIMFFLTNKAIKQAECKNSEQEDEEDPISKLNLKEKIKYYIDNFPFRDLRFLFFIFILIPVQTLFAHNWLTIPMYCERAFQGSAVSSNFEFFSNINPILIFVLTPIVTSLTSKANVYKMMVYGTLVMALPTFFLALGPSIYTLMAYLLLMTIGEAMWQPRFLQLIAEIAPKGMVGIYMGIGQFPWFLTKVITSMYSGWFLMKYCPAGVAPSAMNTQFMWFIYALIAVISPIGLILAGKWMKSGFIGSVKDASP